jgi:molecular chaperone GrpE (heat shock protein)
MERCGPPKIRGPLRAMEFSDDDTEEEEEEEEEKRSNELVVTLKQKIASLEEQVAELHLVVYDQKDDFDILHKATTSKLKCFAKALGDPLLCNAPSP